MHDTIVVTVDHTCLFDHASGQRGYFTAAQARTCGFTWDLLTHHTRRGRFVRVRRGLYRLRDYPSSSREEVIAAWLAAGREIAVVSHESALDLYGLSDVVPDAVHLTVPRAKRYLRAGPGTKIHTSTRPLRATDVTVWEGARVTSATRSILDAAESGTAPEQIELAVAQAIARGLTTVRQLSQDARHRGGRVARLITSALSRVEE